jgi:hypothetical protein
MSVSALDKLKAAAAQKSNPAANTQTQAAQAPVQTPAAVAPTPTQTATQSQPKSTPAPAASVNTLYVPPTSVSNDDDARKALALLRDDDQEDSEAGISTIFDDMNNSGGISFSHPFAQIKVGNWNVHQKSCPETVFEYMPVGSRAFTMIYLGHRVGATGWPSTNGAPPAGLPPTFKFALPHRKLYPDATELTRQVLAVGSRIQYKKLPEERWAPLGKLTPEVHIFGWTPKTGFIILSVPGFNSAELTCNALSQKSVRDVMGEAPLVFSIEKNSVVNKKAKPGDKNANWVNYYAAATLNHTDEKSKQMYAEWKAFKDKNVIDVANQCMAFQSCQDFKGLTTEETAKLIGRYQALG